VRLAGTIETINYNVEVSKNYTILARYYETAFKTGLAALRYQCFPVSEQDRRNWKDEWEGEWLRDKTKNLIRAVIKRVRRAHAPCGRVQGPLLATKDAWEGAGKKRNSCPLDGGRNFSSGEWPGVRPPVPSAVGGNLFGFAHPYQIIKWLPYRISNGM